MGNSESRASAASASTVRLIFADGKGEGAPGEPAGQRCHGGAPRLQRLPRGVLFHRPPRHPRRPFPRATCRQHLLRPSRRPIRLRRPPHGFLHRLPRASLASSPTTSSLNHHNIWSLGDSPFEYVKGSDGRRVIKVCPDFIVGVLKKAGEAAAAAGGTLCSSPELQRQYTMLVGSKNQARPPKLETITEATAGLSRRKFGWCSSPCAFFLDRRYMGEVYD